MLYRIMDIKRDSSGALNQEMKGVSVQAESCCVYVKPQKIM